MLRKITEDDTKYYYIVSALDSATATRAVSILSQPPITGKYANIKKFLTSAYELSDYERASSLFNIRGLGDLKPSELMDNMLALIGSNTPCVLFKYLFLQSFLSDRSQYVQIYNVKSNPHSVSCGILQGSVMGPLLFNIFINDIINATTKFTLIMYADDTTLVSHLENFGTTNIEIEREINKEISKVNTWLLSNKLVLNVAKSKFMLFFKHPKVVPTLKLLINGNPIEQVTNFNFLGITIDQNITWSDHITKISIKVTRVIGILSKLKHIFPRNILRTIYNSLIHPHLIYGLYLWGFSPKRLIILQKKAVRTISLSRYLSHSTPLFKNLKILKIDDQYSIQLYKLYYKNTNNLLPSYFNSFTPYYNNEEHSHNLRSMTLRLPMTRREFFVQSTKYQLLKLVRETSVIDLN